MAELVIKNFSCIEEAKIDFATLTILIGPQASGKSVISKLAYFFYEILTNQFRAIEDGVELEAFTSSLVEDFKKWFPPSAWGTRAFSITFRAGVYFVKVSRPSTKNAAQVWTLKLTYHHISKISIDNFRRPFRIRSKRAVERTAI